MAQGTPFVASGEPLMCTMGSAFNAIKVTSQQVKKLGGQLQATDGDKTPPQFLESPSCFGTCSATGGKPCQAMIAIAGEWQKTDSHYAIKGHHPLTVASQLPCSKGGMIKFQYKELATVIEMAMIANHSYYKPSEELEEDEPPLPPGVEPVPFSEYPDGLDESRLWKHSESGFNARLYKKGDEYIVAFRGTEDGKDWASNYLQGLGLSETQYKKAEKLAWRLKESSIADQTTITGHSLGGGLASLAGAKTQLPTYTFNSAGLHEKTLTRYGLEAGDTAGVQAYYGDDDILNMVQDNRKKLLSLLPASLRYGSKGAVQGAGLGETVGGATGEFLGGVSELPSKAAAQVLEWGGELDQSVGSALDRSNIPVIEDLGAWMNEQGGVEISTADELRDSVEPWSDHTRGWGEDTGEVAGGAVGGVGGAGKGALVDSNPVAKAIDVNTTDDLPQAKGTRRRITTEAPNPSEEFGEFLQQPTTDKEELKQLMQDAKAGHDVEPLIKALEALQARGAKHYTTSK